jgi:hypothetical protein
MRARCFRLKESWQEAACHPELASNREPCRRVSRGTVLPPDFVLRAQRADHGAGEILRRRRKMTQCAASRPRAEIIRHPDRK